MPEDDNQAEMEEFRRLAGEAISIKGEAAQLRQATQEFAETLRRGLVRATIQGVALTFAAVILAVSFLGYLTGKTWTCDPTALRDGTFSYWVCDKAFPQTTQQARYLQESQKANAAVAQLVVDLKGGLEEQKRQKAVLEEVERRLNPNDPKDIPIGTKRTCAILRELVPTSPLLEGCPAQ